MTVFSKTSKMYFTKSIVLLAVASVTLVSCKKPGAAAAKSNEEIEAIYAVNTFRTTEGNMDDYLEFGGDVASVSAVAVMPDMAGKVSRIRFSVGDTVKKDDIIAYVDASRPGMNYSASPVKAPIAGRITAIPPTVGTMVSQQTAIATISNTDILEVKINIAERFISRIKEKQNAIVTFDAYPGIEFSAYAHEVSPVLDTSTRTMSVKLRFNKKDDRIKVGMYGRVKLITDTIQNALIVPTTAIVQKNEEPYVYVVSNRNGSQASVRLQKIEEGITVDNKTEIIDGLVAGDEIVIKGQSLLNDGSKVNVISVSELD